MVYLDKIFYTHGLPSEYTMGFITILYYIVYKYI